MNAIKNGRMHCPTCKCLMKCECNHSVMGAGDLVMVLLTLGAWLCIRIAWDGVSNPWRCAACGTRCRPPYELFALFPVIIAIILLVPR